MSTAVQSKISLLTYSYASYSLNPEVLCIPCYCACVHLRFKTDDAGYNSYSIAFIIAKRINVKTLVLYGENASLCELIYQIVRGEI